MTSPPPHEPPSYPAPSASDAIPSSPTPPPPPGSSPWPGASANGANVAQLLGRFLPSDERITRMHYLGVLGLWGIGIRSFAAVTDRRVVSLRIQIFGGVQYEDAGLDEIVSTLIVHRSRLWLYATLVGVVAALTSAGFGIHPAVGVVALVLSVLLTPLTVRLYYRFRPSGLLLSVRGGNSVLLFIDNEHREIAAEFHREYATLREERARVTASRPA
jgi:hypothetical protein